MNRPWDGLRTKGTASQAAKKLTIGQERRTSGANARCGEAARRILIVYGTTKVVP
jgi:hypothetical protein